MSEIMGLESQIRDSVGQSSWHPVSRSDDTVQAPDAPEKHC